MTGSRLPNTGSNANAQFLLTSVPGTILIRALTDMILLQSSQLREVDIIMKEILLCLAEEREVWRGEATPTSHSC